MKRYPYYHTCPRCGANLDPGECCDCLESQDWDFHICKEDAA